MNTGLPLGHSVRILRPNKKADRECRFSSFGPPGNSWSRPQSDNSIPSHRCLVAPSPSSVLVRGEPPASGLLGRLRAFIPALKAANAELEERISAEGPETVNIEVVEEGERHIDMVRTIVSERRH